MRFERIYSPREREIKRRRNAVKATRKWRALHPDWVEAQKPHFKRYMQEWHRNHPDYTQMKRKREVQQMAKGYLGQLLRQHGRPVSPETLAQKRVELQAYRTRKLFRMIYATSQIAS